MNARTFWMILGMMMAVRLALMATVPVFEPSEARYAAISANMARSGDFVVPHFTHDLEYQSFDGKPPLVFQAGGVFCRVFGVCEFAVRLFPFLSAALLLFILHWTVKRAEDVGTARLAVVVCASCTAFYAAAGISMTDMSLACCVAGALLLYGEGARNRDAGGAGNLEIGCAAGVAAMLGLGMIVKGPVALALFALPVVVEAAVNRHWRRIFAWKWLAVAPIFLVLAVPWFVLVEQRNPGAVWYFFYNENFMRFISHEYGDKYGAGREAFRGVSILWAFVATLPWILVPVWTGVCAARTHGCRDVRPLFRQWGRFVASDFRLLAALVIVGFWCLTSRVLIYYLFPVIPLVAAAIALHGDRPLLRRLAPWGAGVSVVVLIGALACGSLFSDKMRGVRTEASPIENHYAYEFYHGRLPPGKMAEFRAIRKKFVDYLTQRKKEEGR